MVDALGSPGGGAFPLSFRLETRTTDTSDLSISPGEWLTVSNTTGSALTVNLPSDPDAGEVVALSRRDDGGSAISASPGTGDTVNDGVGSRNQLPGGRFVYHYDATVNTWWEMVGTP